MNKIILTAALALAASLSFSGCANDWTIKDVPPIAEKADGFGYASGFDTEASGVIIPVEVTAADTYNIVLHGRATQDGTPGTGAVSVADGASADFSFAKAGAWQDVTVQLALPAGVSQLDINRGSGNGLFDIDYIEVK